MYSILLVDDEPIVKIAFQKVIDWQTTDFCISGTASNGREALDLMEKAPADAVITDLRMPVMDGIALMRHLRENGFQGPILVLSNYSDYSLVRGALTEGAFDYLLKVNMDAPQILAMLEKMSGLIRTRMQQEHEQQRKDDLIRTQKREMSIASLREYLTDGNTDGEVRISGELFPDGLFPAVVCTVLHPAASAGPEINLLSLEAVVREVFEDVQPVFLLQLHKNELLFLVSETALQEKKKDLRGKLLRLSKQIRIYFSAQPLITCLRGADSPAALKLLYQAVERSYVRTFYASGDEPLYLQSAPSVEDLSAIQADTMTRVLASLREKNWLEFQAVMQHFLETCALRQARPEQVIETVAHIIWFGHDIGTLPATAEQMNSIMNRLYSSQSAAQLDTTMREFLARTMQLSSQEIHPIKKEIQKAMLYVNMSFSQKISLDDVAGEVGLNREYLSRLFRQETGSSLFQYINEVRMRKAAEMLASGSTVFVKEIAAAVGFDDPYFFSKKFKEYFGVSPTEYKPGSAAEV